MNVFSSLYVPHLSYTFTFKCTSYIFFLLSISREASSMVSTQVQEECSGHDRCSEHIQDAAFSGLTAAAGLNLRLTCLIYGQYFRIIHFIPSSENGFVASSQFPPFSYHSRPGVGQQRHSKRVSPVQ